MGQLSSRSSALGSDRVGEEDEADHRAGPGRGGPLDATELLVDSTIPGYISSPHISQIA
jgi:hypothetical protein